MSIISSSISNFRWPSLLARSISLFLSLVHSDHMFLLSIKVYVGALSVHYEALSVEASKQTTADEIVSCIAERLGLTGNNYELAEVIGHCKERRLSPHEKPVSLKLLWKSWIPWFVPTARSQRVNASGKSSTALWGGSYLHICRIDTNCRQSFSLSTNLQSKIRTTLSESTHRTHLATTYFCHCR